MAKNKDLVKKVIVAGSVCTSIFLIGAVGFASYIASDIIKFNKLLENPNIYQNIYIGNLDVSNMEKEFTKSLIQEEVERDRIILTYNDKQFEFSKIEIGANYHIEEAVETAYNIARLGTPSENRKEIKNLQEFQTNIDLEMFHIDEEIIANIERIAETINILSKEPILTKNEDGFHVERGNIGLEVDVQATYLDVISALYKADSTNVEITVIETNPEQDYNQLEKIQTVIGTFSTSVAGSDANRLTNVRLAAEGVNGSIVNPGEVFSTNEAFSERTVANGYKSATTIVNGEFVDGMGGGICQVSSTLYNAVLFAELDVVERQSHSMKVGYLDYGYDAVIAGDYLDFKFRNSSDTPIYIESSIQGTNIVCTIYGEETRASNRTIKFQNALTETIQPSPEIVTETSSLPTGERKVTTTALNGYKYALYKLIYVDNVLQDKVYVSSSYYKPRQGSVLVGTGAVAPQTQEASTSQVDTDLPVQEIPQDLEQNSQEVQVEVQEEIYEPQIQAPVITVSTELEAVEVYEPSVGSDTE